MSDQLHLQALQALVGAVNKIVLALSAIPLPVASGGTGTTTAFTTGSVVFAGSGGVYTQDNSNLFFDNTNNRLGIGTATPAVPLDVVGAFTGTSAAASALAIGRLGATTPALLVDASTAISITGVKVKSAASGGGVAVSAIGETNVALTIDAAGSGTITLGGTSTGAITLTRATTLSAALTYGGITLTNNVTGTGKMVLDTSPTIATPVINSAAHVGGTWVADAAWTLPALTLGGTITGAGNNVNNIVVNNGILGAGGNASATTYLALAAGTTSASALRFVQGAAPTSPVDGDMWREDNTDTGLKIRINSTTKTIVVA